jgi:hypothetical protein
MNRTYTLSKIQYLVKETQQTQSGIEADNTSTHVFRCLPFRKHYTLQFVILPLFSPIPYEFTISKKGHVMLEM